MKKIRLLFVLLFISILGLPFSFGVIKNETFSETFNGYSETIYGGDCLYSVGGADNIKRNQFTNNAYKINSSVLNLDNNWYCYFHAPQTFNNNTFSIEDNKLKYWSSQYSSSGTNSYLFFTYLWDEPVSFTDNTRFIFIYNSSFLTRANILSFNNVEGHDILNIGLLGNTFGLGINISLPICELNTTFRLTEVEREVSFTMQDIKNQCPWYAENGSFVDISQLHIKTQWGFQAPVIAQRVDINNIIIDVIETGTNELPFFSLSANDTTQCINTSDSTSRANFNLDINAIDPEGDIILYGSGVSTVNFSQFVSFNNWGCLPFEVFCRNAPNFPIIINSFLELNNTCEINVAPLTIREDKHNIVLGTDALNEEAQLLEISGFCNELDKAVYYDYKKLFKNGAIELEFISVDLFDSFNVSLLSSNLREEYLNLNIDANGSKINISYTQDGIKTPIINFTTVGNFEGQFRLFFSNSRNINEYDIRATYSDDGLSLTTKEENNITVDYPANEFKILRVGVDNDDLIHLATILSVLNQYDLTFSTEKPNIPVFDRVGSFNYFVYLTDDVHNSTDGDFKKENIWLHVTACGGIYDYQIGNVDYRNFLESGNVVYNNLCTNTNQVINLLGKQSALSVDMCNALYNLYMLIALLISLAIGTAVYLSVYSPYISYGVASMVFFLSNALMYRIFMFSVNMQIALAVLFASSMISLFFGVFGNKNI